MPKICTERANFRHRPCIFQAKPSLEKIERRDNRAGAMKNMLKLISGIAASLALTVGLNATAERLDPMGKDAGLNKPSSSTDDPGKVSLMPCAGCANNN